MNTDNSILHLTVCIVADSVPDNEWMETQNKASTLLRAAEMVLDGLDAEVHH